MDYLSRLPEDRTPETFHDYKPSHYQRPSYLIEAAAEFYSQQYERWQAELAEQLEVAG